MMSRVAGRALWALGERDAVLGRARLPHQLPPAVAVGLAGVSSVPIAPRERWDGWGGAPRWGGAPLRRDARHAEAG
jgi:hypothetical protein